MSTPVLRPKISIVMTTYDRIEYIAPAIRSVLAQSRGDFEFLIWDDGSSDPKIVELLRSFERSDPRVRVFESPHLGRFPALKAVFEKAVGEYLGFMDSDDIMAVTCLEECAAALDSHPQAGWLYTDYRVMNERGEDLGIGSRCQIQYAFDRMLVDFMTFHFRLMRRATFEQAGGVDDRWSCAGDYDLCLRLAEVTPPIKLAKSLYYYRVHGNAISSQRRVEQIQTSAKIIEAAMARRGMNKEWDLHVEIVGKYRLRRKAGAPPLPQRPVAQPVRRPQP